MTLSQLKITCLALNGKKSNLIRVYGKKKRPCLSSKEIMDKTGRSEMAESRRLQHGREGKLTH